MISCFNKQTMIKDLQSIIYKYHHNLLMKDVCDEIKNIKHFISYDPMIIGRGSVIKTYYSFNSYFGSHYYEVHHQTLYGRVLSGLIVSNDTLLSQILD